MPRLATQERSDLSEAEETCQRQEEIDTRWTDLWKTVSQYTTAGPDRLMPEDDREAYTKMSRITKALRTNGTFRDMAVDQYLDHVHGARILGNPFSTDRVMALK
jgi:hypothetical protein